jgi:pSer/pThr/pTyr-binding forkhead associated (FHA) protein
VTPPASSRATTAGEFALVVQVDATLDVDPDASAPCPVGVGDVVVVVARAELLVGRRDDLRDVHPDIPLNDPGASRRHAKFVRAPDGSLVFVDLASANGSKLNGVDVVPGSRSPLHVGDEVTLGRWTRIRVTGPT